MVGHGARQSCAPPQSQTGEYMEVIRCNGSTVQRFKRRSLFMKWIPILSALAISLEASGENPTALITNNARRPAPATNTAPKEVLAQSYTLSPSDVLQVK